MRVLIMSGYGINCEDETLHAFENVGFRGEIVHVNNVVDNPKMINKYQVIAFPGGFSYGDDTGSGNAMANKIKNNFLDYLLEFLLKDKLIIGICNGCQILVNLGVVPSSQNTTREVALVENDCAIYQCRWINLKISNNYSPWLYNINHLYLPVAHQEGKFIMSNEIQKNILKNKLIACQYADEKNNLAKKRFPYNPNGSTLDIAALINKKGNVLAMMPHPERAYYFTHLPDWQDKKSKSKYADGYKIFRNASRYFS